MAELKEIFTRDTDLETEYSAWSSSPVGLLLLIEESPEYYLLIDDDGNRLLIE